MMLGPLTHQAITMLTRRRLERLRRQLDAKIRSARGVSDVERRLRFLADRAEKLLSSSPQPSLEFAAASFAPWLSESVSKYALLGSLGPEIPRFSAWLAPSGEWLADTIHRGQADPDRQRVFAGTTDLPLELWRRADGLIGGEAGLDEAAKKTARERMGAYVLGHLCHVAADTVAAPFLTDVTAHLGVGKEGRVGPQQAADALEEAVTRVVFKRQEARGREWRGFWLTPQELPAHFFEAYKLALETLYGPGARRTRDGATFADPGFFPPGSQAFEKRIKDDAPPLLSNQLLREGYTTYRAVFERDWAWSYGDWLGATLFMFLGPFLTLPLALVLPEGSRILRDELPAGASPVDVERGWFEVLTFPLAANSLVPLIMNIYLGAGTYMGVGADVGLGFGASLTSVAAGITFFATLGVDKLPAGFRWPVLFALPFAFELLHMIFVLARGRGEEPRRVQLALAPGLHLLIALLFVGAYAGWLRFGVYALRDAIAGEPGTDKGKATGTFLLTALGWLGVLAIVWLVLPLLLPRRDPKRPSVSDRRHFLGLFDDATLFVDPGLAAATAADLHFPSRRRPLVAMWWTGAGDLFVRAGRDRLEFTFTEDGSGAFQSVMAPLAAMTAAEFAAFLGRAVTNAAGGFSAELKAKRADDDPLDYALGPGLVFADFGDDKDDRAGHDEAAKKLVKLPKTEAAALVLHHAPRERRTVRFGNNGPLLDVARDTAAGSGTIGPGAVAGQVLGAGGTRFVSFFRPGDVIETTGLGTDEARLVVSVADDTHLAVNVAFTAAVVAGTGYRRRVESRDGDVPGSGTIAPAAVFRDLVGTATAFDRFFMPGDIIRARPSAGGETEQRTVVAVASATGLSLDDAFSPLVTAGSFYERAGRKREQGVAFLPEDPTALFFGDSVMDSAADLATLLCLGAASHVVPQAELAAVTAGTAEARHPAIDRVYQVFRNWNLDLRRVNEWKMLVAGDAVSEKRGAPGDPDPLQPRTPLPPAWNLRVAAGEPVANRLGWTRTLSRWLDAARRPGVDMREDVAFRPGDPTKLELSQALAYLLDMPDPRS